MEPTQPLGKFLPKLHSIVEGETSGLRDARGTLMPPCIITDKGEALDVWIENSGDAIDLFAGLQVCHDVRSCCAIMHPIDASRRKYRVVGHTSLSHLFRIS